MRYYTLPCYAIMMLRMYNIIIIIIKSLVTQWYWLISFTWRTNVWILSSSYIYIYIYIKRKKKKKDCVLFSFELIICYDIKICDTGSSNNYHLFSSFIYHFISKMLVDLLACPVHPKFHHNVNKSIMMLSPPPLLFIGSNIAW